MLVVVNPADAKTWLANVSSPIVVLVGGVITFIKVTQTAGAVDYVSTAAAGIGIPLLVALLLCYMAGIVPVPASSSATIGVAIAVAGPMLDDGAVNPIGFVAATAISATVVMSVPSPPMARWCRPILTKAVGTGTSVRCWCTLASSLRPGRAVAGLVGGIPA
ncbi:hypothetical protein [Nocardia sp. NPDC005745]|uniref:hypothetical protein n=1 Tax=Nocardia sp. NPDC005745 TaxID=3157061 RepID=UPI0033FA420D